MSVAIIDYGSGNLHSAAKAFERAARSLENGQKVFVTVLIGSRIAFVLSSFRQVARWPPARLARISSLVR